VELERKKTKGRKLAWFRTFYLSASGPRQIPPFEVNMPCRSLSHRSIAFMALLLGFFGLLSCQEDAPTSPAPGTFPVAQGWSLGTDTLRLPDSVSWSLGSDNGAFTLVRRSPDSFHIADTFPHSIAGDTLQLGLWTLGMRTTIAPALVRGDGSLAVISELRHLDSTVLKILASFDSARARGGYGRTTDSLAQREAALSRFIAAQILSGVLLLPALPAGVDTSTVVSDIVMQAAEAGQSLATASRLSGIDSVRLQSRAYILLQSGVLPLSDSTVLFPLYPVRIRLALALDTPAVVEGVSVAVRGAVSWNRGVVPSLRFSVHTPAGIDSIHFSFPVRRFAPQPSDTTWTLSGNLSLQALSGAVPGWDTLVLMVADDSGHLASTRFPFRVAPAVPAGSGPRITRVSPVTDSATVGYDTRTYELIWTVMDDSSVTATVNGASVYGAANLYKSVVQLVPGIDTFRFEVRGKGGRSAYDTVRITRLRDMTRPLVVRGAGTRDTVVLASVAALPVSWKVTDNALASVTIGGRNPTLDGNGYDTLTVPLVGDSTWIRLVATDSSSNTQRDSILVRRLSPPLLGTHGGILTASQTPTLQISATGPVDSIEWSINRTNWYRVTGGILVSESEVVYARTRLGSAISALDSAVFLYLPSISPPSGASSGTLSVSVTVPGNATIEDSISGQPGWHPHTADVQVLGNTRFFSRTRLSGLTSRAVEADYAYRPSLTPDSVRKVGSDSATVTISASGADSVETALDTNGTWLANRTESVTMRSCGTVYARTRVGSATSAISRAVVQLQLAPPTLSPGTDTSSTPLQVTLSGSSGATLRWTEDGSTPASTSPAYSGPIAVGATKRLRAVAFRDGFLPSEPAEASYLIGDTNTYGIPWNSKIQYGTLFDARDSQIYRTVKIGTQTWMAQNLNFAQDYGFCSKDSGRSCKKYGWYYNRAWPGSDPCPTGWHTPNDSEWNVLLREVDSGSASAKLKSGAGWSDTGNGIDAFGFRGLPGGHEEFLASNYLANIGQEGIWWSSSTSSGSGYEFFWRLGLDAVVGHSTVRSESCQVRCLMNP
jgi:uncharacterized protein (TIGR02145 family)